MENRIINNSELLEIWDWESGKPTGVSISRGESYRTGAPHEGVHLWIVRETAGDVEILFQRRAKNKALYPDCLDITVGGHVPFGIGESKIGKEAMEEIGIEIDESDLFDLGYARFEEKTETYHHREFQHVYLLADGRPLDRYRFNDGEVTGIYAVPSVYVEKILSADCSFEVQGYDGKSLQYSSVSRKDFHPMLFDIRMKDYMSVIITGARELVRTGKVSVSMTPV